MPSKSLSRSRSVSRSRSRSRNRSAGRNGSSFNSRSRSRSGSRGRDRDHNRHRSRSSSVGSENDYYRLHIANLTEDADRNELQDLFKKFGELKEVWMARVPPCFGFAVFRKKENARAALKAIDGTSFCGHRLRVTNARPRTRGHRRRFYTGSMRCFQCGMTGHFYRDCKDINNHSRNDGRSSRDSNGSNYRNSRSRYSPSRSSRHRSSRNDRRSRRYSD